MFHTFFSWVPLKSIYWLIQQYFQECKTLQKVLCHQEATVIRFQCRAKNATYDACDKPLQSGVETKCRGIQDPPTSSSCPSGNLNLNLHWSTGNFVFEFFFLQIAFICWFWISLFHINVLRCLFIFGIVVKKKELESGCVSSEPEYLSTLSSTVGWCGAISLESHGVCTSKAC